MNNILKIILKTLGMIVAIYLMILAIGLLQWSIDQKAVNAIAKITTSKITLNDVMGSNLPPAPDQTLNDSTVAGIDANKNGIRDDVELAIFKKYPNSAKTRAAELQYAQALQLELTQVFSSETFVATLQKEGKAVDCLGEAGPNVSLKDTHEKIVAALAVSDNWKKEVDSLILNADIRKEKDSDNLNKYMTTYSSLAGEQCDINLSSLPN